MTKPKKPPPDVPAQDDRCCLRGNRLATGRLTRHDEPGWAWVDWDAGVSAPRIVHRFELQRIAPSNDDGTQPARSQVVA